MSHNEFLKKVLINWERMQIILKKKAEDLYCDPNQEIFNDIVNLLKNWYKENKKLINEREKMLIQKQINNVLYSIKLRAQYDYGFYIEIPFIDDLFDNEDTIYEAKESNVISESERKLSEKLSKRRSLIESVNSTY